MTRIALPHLSAGAARNIQAIALRSFYIIVILSMLLANLALPQQIVSAAGRPEKTSFATVDNASSKTLDSIQRPVINRPQPRMGVRAQEQEFSSRQLIGAVQPKSLEVSASQSLDDTNQPTWNFFGGAGYMTNPDAILLTPANLYRSGSAWNAEQIDLSKGFDKTFKIYLGNNYYGADGIAFVLQDTGAYALGYGAGQIGYGGLYKSLAVEVDTHYNPEYNDPSQPHIAIHEYGNPSSAVVTSLINGNIKDGHEHTLIVRWTPVSKTVTVYLDGVLDLTYQRDIVNDIFDGNSSVWYGFTAGTGAAYNLQYFYETSIVPDDGTQSQDCDCEVASLQDTQEWIVDPINVRTGGFEYTNTDMAFQTSAGPLSFNRYYLSTKSDTEISNLGYGWTYNHDSRLIFPDDPGGEEGTVIFKADSFNQFHFIDNGDGTYTPLAGILATLTRISGSPVTYNVVTTSQNVYTFSEMGKLITWTNNKGQSIQYDYDSDQRLDRISADEGAHYFDITYGDQNRITSVKDHTNRSISFGYDSDGNLISYTDVMGKTWEYTYDPDFIHSLTRVINPNNAIVTRVEYVLPGRAIQEFDNTGKKIFELTTVEDGTFMGTDALNHSTVYNYSGRNALAGVTDNFGKSSAKTYDNNFRPTEITDQNNHSTQLAWSEDGKNLTNITDAAGNQTSMGYDPYNNLTSVVDPENHLTTYTYTDSNHPTLMTSSTDALNHTTSYTYTSQGLLASVTDPLGNTTSYTYNDFGQRISMTDAQGKVTNYTYDELGRQKTVRSPSGRTDWACYDAADRVIRTVTNASGDGSTAETDPCDPENYQPSTDSSFDRINSTVYDDAGTQIASIDPAGRINRTFYGADNRPIAVVQNLTGQSIDTSTLPDYNPDFPDQNVITQTVYDDGGNVIATINPAGKITRTFYDENNRPVTVVQNLVGQDISTANSPTFDLSFPDQNIRTDTVYDDAGIAIATINTLGIITRTYYDSNNRPVAVAQNLYGQTIDNPNPPTHDLSHPDRNVLTQTVYDKNGNAIATIGANDAITRTYYDALNRPIVVVQNLTGQAIADETPPAYDPSHPDRNVLTDYVYDQAGNQIAVIDNEGTVTRTYYDSNNRSYAVAKNLSGQDINYSTPPTYKPAHPDKNLITYTTYGENGNVIATTDPQGVITRTYYDALNRPATVVKNLTGQAITNSTLPTFDPAYPDRNIISQTVYDVSGAVITAIANNGATTHSEYDALGRSVRAIDPNGNTTVSEYDGVGNLISTTNGADQKTTYEYDAAARQVKVTDPAGNETDYSYDANGNRASQMDANGVVSAYEYDQLGRLTAVVENYRPVLAPDVQTNIRTEYTYDSNGNRLTIKDGNGNVTTFSYDDLNRQVSETDPLGHITQTSYDRAGNRSQVIDANGNTTSYQYNQINNLTTISSGPGDVYSAFQYDAGGRLTQMADRSGKTSLNYDSLGRAQSISREYLDQNNNDVTRTVGYEYDPAGNRAKLTYPDGKTASYNYDAGNRLQSVTADWRNSTINYAYDAANRVSGVSLPNGTQSTYSYDSAGHLTQLAETKGNKSFASYQYSYDNVGNRTQAVEQMATNEQVIPSVAVMVKDSAGNPKPGLTVDAYTDDVNTGYSAITDTTGVARLILPEGSYRFQTGLNGYQYFSGDNNDCNVLGCQSSTITVPQFGDVTVTVQDSSSAPLAGLPVFVFNGDTDTGLEGQSDANGQITFTLPEGSYRFRADKNGFQYFSGTDNTCTVPSCTSAGISVPRFGSVAVTVADTNSAPQAGLTVYAFDGDDNTGINAVTDENGVATLLLPEGNYRFGASVDGQFYYSGTENDCTILGCDSAAVTVEAAQQNKASKMALRHNLAHLLSEENGGGTVIVTVVDGNGAAQAGLPVDVRTGGWSIGLQETSDENGQASFTLPAGDYDFWVEISGRWFSSTTDDACTVPDCESVTFTVPVLYNVTVDLKDSNGAPMTGYWISAFQENANPNISAVSDGNGDVVLALPEGSYRFGVNVIGREYFNGTDYDCTLPGCDSASITLPPFYSVTVTVQDSNGAPLPYAWITALDGENQVGYSAQTDANGQATIIQLPEGSYRFQAELNGFKYYSADENDCTVPGCQSDSITTPLFHDVTVTVQDSNGGSLESVGVNVYDGDTYIGSAGFTDENGQISFGLPEGNYRFEVDLNDEQYFSGTTNECSVPTCTSDTITVPANSNVTVTVYDPLGIPQVGLAVHVYNGDTDTGNLGYTDENGQVVFSLSRGSYRFETDLNGSQYFSGSENNCTVPGCQSADIPVPEVIGTVTVTVHDGLGVPQEGLDVHVYKGGTDTGLQGASDDQGQVIFSLAEGSYRFETDLNGAQYFSWADNHCAIPGCQSAAISVPTLYDVTVDLKDSSGAPMAGYWISTRQGDTDPHVAAISDDNGQVRLALPSGSYHFVAGVNGQEYSSGTGNDCETPSCTMDTITVPQYGVVTVSVADSASNPQPGILVEAFNGDANTGYNTVTDDSGQAYLLLPEGSYRFGATVNGLPYFSGTENDCTVVECNSAAIGVPQFAPVTVSVMDSSSAPVAGVPVYAFNGATNTGINALTDQNGQASLLLPEGSYRFEAYRDGFRYFSGDNNDCTVLGCESSAITVPVFYNVTVTVQDSTSAPQAGLDIYTLDGDTQVSDAITSDENGQVTFSLPAGGYRFRADLHGFQYFSNPTNNCTTPDCSSASITTPVFGKVTVTDRSSEYAPQANLPVYAYDDDTYTGVSGLTDSDGYVDLWLPAGDYRFRTDQFNLTYWSGSENNCTVTDCTFTAIYILGTVNAMKGQTINYTYDPLYRLTAADYTDGRYFHYVYDPVGNRLSQDSKTDPITDPVTKTYTYDSANRLTGVNGASYTWDNNGNLISDGTSRYEYDPMNHLTQLVNGNNTYKFNYDSQGNRVSQSVNGAWTYYDLDLNAGLTQVLTAQDEDYLYGLSLVAQNDPGDIEYLLTDGLGTVRQIVRGDSFGQVTLTRSYDPFGSTLTSVGTGSSAFGYAGQWEDGSGLMNMRARYYMPEDGRFITEDSWQGDQNQPMSYDGWLYVYANPVNYIDPSGYDVGCNTDDPRDPRCHNLPPSPTIPPTPTPIPTQTPTPTAITETYSPDPVSLDTSYQNLAHRIKQFYYRLAESNDGWWKIGGQFTPENFLALMLAGEFSPLPQPVDLEDLAIYPQNPVDLLEHATSHWFYGRCELFSPGGNCPGPTPNAVMNFLVASQSTHYRVTAYVDQNQSLTKYSRQTEGNLSLANLVVNAIYNPPNPEWKRGHYTPGDKDTCSSHPWGWGQRSMYSMEPPSKLWSFGSGMSEFFILDNQTARFMVNYPAN